MIKKQRKTKRFIAFALALLLCASCCVMAVGAASIPGYDVTEIPGYNYWDTSKFKPTENLSAGAYNAYIAKAEDVNAREGLITFTHTVVQVGTLYLPSTYTGLTLGDICPDMVVGEEYCLNIENVSIPFGSPKNCIEFKSPKHEETQIWNSGELRVISNIDLEAKVTIPVSYINDPSMHVGDVFKYTLRIWVTKDKPQDFMPHSVFKDTYQNGYNEGFNDGYQEGIDFTVENNLLVSGKNMAITQRVWNNATNELADGLLFTGDDLTDIPFNGYSFNLRWLGEKYRAVPAGCVVAGYQIFLSPVEYGRSYCVGDSPFSLTLSKGMMHLKVRTADGKQVSWYYEADERTVFDVDWEALGLSMSDEITAILIVVGGRAPYVKSFDGDFSFVFANADSYAFQVGEKQGLEEGYQNGYTEGMNEGYTEGKSEGYNEGYAKGEEHGYSEGKDKGYYEGRADEQEESGLFGLAYAVVDAPVSALSNLLGFEILGVNIGNLFFSVISFFLMLAIVFFLRRTLF